MASHHRPRAGATALGEADVLKRFIEAIESGQLLDTSPQDEVVVRHLQQALTAIESIPGAAP